MTTAVHWSKLQRHPLSAEYKDIQGPAWFAFTLRMKRMGFLAMFPIILHEGMILDGYQRFRGCVELNIEPEFGLLPDGMDPREYVEAVNDERRHESDADRQARRERVAAKIGEGKSKNVIADEEGISAATVNNDLAKHQVQGGFVPEPPDGKVTGKDGKKQSAKKKQPTEKKPVAPKPPKNGSVKFDDSAITEAIRKLTRSFDERARALECLNCPKHKACLAALEKVLAAFSQWQVEK